MGHMLPQKKSEQILWIVVGCGIYAAGLNLFILPLGLYSGGIVGLAQLLSLGAETVFPHMEWTVNLYGLIYFLLNIPLLAIAWLKISRRFLAKTMIGTVGISIFTLIVPSPKALLVSDPAVAAVMGGVVTGLGIGVMLTAGGSGGGIEVLGVWLSRKYPDFTVGKLTICFNILLYIVYLLVFDISTVIYSILYMIFYTVAMDKMHYQSINVRIMVFTKKDKIDRSIMNETGRGVTKWDGFGAFTNEESHVLVTVVNKFEIDEILKLIYSLDPDAFTMIDEGIKVYGNFQHRI